MNELIAYCGVDCSICPDYTEGKCTGCRKTDWKEGDTCLPVECCRKQNIASCGDCAGFPCEEMKGFYQESNSHEQAYARMAAKRVKELYFQYLQDTGTLDKEYGPKTPDDLIIQKLVGTYGSGCVVAFLAGDGLFSMMALHTVTIGSVSITFRSSKECYAFYDNAVYTLSEAYEKGILSEKDLQDIAAKIK